MIDLFLSIFFTLQHPQHHQFLTRNLGFCSPHELFRLELKLIEIHKFQKEVTDIKEKYIAERQKDDEERKQIREDHRSLQQQSNT